jgi:2-pyrone-4,6-dicarboxylate lactonase
VQSGLHFFSYEHLLHLLCRDPDRLRGVAILQPGVTDLELEILAGAGVVGARFYPELQPELDLRFLARIHDRGWSSHFLIRGEEQAKAWRAPMLETQGPMVIEHAGWQAPERGLSGEGFRAILELLDTGRCWIKLSPRMSRQPTLPFSDCLPFIHELIRRAPDRMLWGSDWPHPNYFNPMPNDADLIDLLLDWAPDRALQKTILVDNPAELFGFPNP